MRARYFSVIARSQALVKLGNADFVEFERRNIRSGAGRRDVTIANICKQRSSRQRGGDAPEQASLQKFSPRRIAWSSIHRMYLLALAGFFRTDSKPKRRRSPNRALENAGKDDAGLRLFPLQWGAEKRGAGVIHRHIFHNDRLLPIEKARLSAGQSGLICGWGIFTTMRIFRGEAFAYERHWRRLEKDAGIIRLPMPYASARVRVSLHEVIRANQVTEGAARVYLVYNNIGFWRGPEELPQTDLIICSAPLPEYREPIQLGLREHGRHAASPLAGVKSTSWLPNVWAVAEAQNNGFDEVVLLNERGEIAECTAANIFAVKKGKVYTPPLNSGCLEGVTRGILFEIAPEAGVGVVEQVLRPEDLYSADEVFISSTNRNLLGVGEIAGHKIASAPGPVTRHLDELFDAHIAEYVSRRLASATK
jgi:branched-chain amino acid aminotransferase